MNYETLLVEKYGETTIVTLNIPDKLNPIGARVVEELTAAWEKAKEDGTRFIVFTGAGRAFSAGANLREADTESKKGIAYFQSARIERQKGGHKFMRELERLEQITICAINGIAAGAGVALALACDFRIASDKATLSIPEVNVGLFFTWGCTPRLIRLVGPSKAKELIMTCDTIDAAEALRIGLVNKVVPHEKLMDSVKEMIEKIASKAPHAIRMTKMIANAVSTPLIGDISFYEPDLVAICYGSGDPVEGHKAFLEKRKPSFKGRMPHLET